MPSDAFAERILKLVQAKGYQPVALDELAERLGVEEGDQNELHDAYEALLRAGRLVVGPRKTIRLPEPPRRCFGTFRAHPRGFGFVTSDVPYANGDIYVSASGTRGAMTGDRVEVEIRKRGKRGGKMLYEGRVVTIAERGLNRFVGVLQKQASRWIVVPDGSTSHSPVQIDDPGAKRARCGDRIVVEIIEFPTDRKPARGVIVKRLGPEGEPGVDALSVIEQYQLPGDFPNAVMEAARSAATDFDVKRDTAGRVDLSTLTVITIDPDDARDFDDAISLEQIADGQIELGVHIADVAHFVGEGSPLDVEARERGNSVYLPGIVIPMLPEVLSNGVCSLQEHQLRLTKTAFITYDHQGRVCSTRFANSLIRSTKRLTYRQATAVLERRPGRLDPRVVRLLKEMETLARAIQSRRREEGMLALCLPEVELILDDSGQATDVAAADTSFSHTIIEMFMVEANEAVARLLSENQIPFLRRIHEEPDALRRDALLRLVKSLGQQLPKRASRKDLQQLLETVRESPETFAVNLAVLRSMQQAKYAPAKVGHFALASENYCHFTSPIRRYPDLIIHRLLDSLMSVRNGGPSPAKACPSESELAALGDHCSAMERRAEAAERELKLVFILRLLQGRMGEKFQGVISGISQAGLFVQLGYYLIDGLVRFESLGNDRWEPDVERGCLFGERTGKEFRIGDRVAVVISEINIPKRQLNLVISGSNAVCQKGDSRPLALPKKRRPGRSRHSIRNDGSRGPRSRSRTIKKKRRRG